MKTRADDGRGRRRRQAPAQAAEAGLSGPAPERHQDARRSRARRGVRRRRSCRASTRSRRSSTASRASSISAASRSKGPGRRSCSANIIGCYNLFEAARRKGVKRVVFASSNHAVGFYPRHAPHRHRRHRAARFALRRQQGVRRGAGRAVCRQARPARAVPADRQRRRQAARPAPAVDLDLSRRTSRSSIRIGLEHPELRYEIFYGASYNERAWWDNSRAYDYGYRPTGRAEDHRDAALAAQAKLAPDPVGDFYQGGPFCSAEFTGDRDRIWKHAGPPDVGASG